MSIMPYLLFLKKKTAEFEICHLLQIKGGALWNKNEVKVCVLRNTFNFHSVHQIMNSSGLLQCK